MSKVPTIKTGALILIVLGAIGLAVVLGTPDIERIRTRVADAGPWGPGLFFVSYAALALIPCPKALLTAAGGAMFGLWWGAALALTAALVGGIVSFGLGRVLGRETVNRLIRGRMAQIDASLGNHGLSAILVARLVPVVPFIAVNYASGLSGVRFRHFVLGSAVGMIPGTLAYTALGAYGTSPWGLAAAGTALLALLAGGTWWARRLGSRRTTEATTDGTRV